MAFSHLAGTTDAGAPDEVVNWFAKFETWITAVGWNVVSGAGTTDLVLLSTGEAGGLTMLYVRVWRDGVNPNWVHMEVQDDALGTHTTNEGGYVDSGGVQFAFWMSADKDAIVLVWKVGAGYRMVYGGLVMPFALSTTDETYRMVACSDIDNGSILRRFDGVWDQDDFLYENQYIWRAAVDRLDGSYPLGGVYFGDNDQIAGQLKHVSCKLTAPAINPEDDITTGQTGATTTWVVLTDSLGNKFALRTGGVLPVGYADGAHFAHASGLANTVTLFIQALVPHMQAVGWTATDYSGVSGRAHDWFFHSTGESGTEDIYLRVAVWGASNWLYHSVTDGIPGAHATTEQHANVVAADFPTQYYISADLDCLTYTINDGGFYSAVWMGLLLAFAPGLPDSTYKSCCVAYTSFSTANMRMLRGHGGLWNDGGMQPYNADGMHTHNSQPNLYDGTTYLVWPHYCYESVGGGLYEIIGQLKYYFFTHGGGIASLDTITVAGQTYTVFFYDAINANRFALRTA